MLGIMTLNPNLQFALGIALLDPDILGNSNRPLYQHLSLNPFVNLNLTL